MPAIINEYAKIYQEELDKELVAGIQTKRLELKGFMVKYNGGKECKIAKLAFDGLADYSRTTGATEGNVTFEYVTRELSKDRAKKFTIDEMDVDETNGALLPAQVMGEFQRVEVIPEIDALRMSSIYQAVNTANPVVTRDLDPATIYAELTADIMAVMDKAGEQNTVVYLSTSAMVALMNSAEYKENVVSTRTELGGVVRTLHGVELVQVSNDRMFAEYVFGLGFSPVTESGNINYIVVPDKSIVAVAKVDKMKVMNPESDDDGFRWRMLYRLYHDCWVLDSGLDVIKIHATIPVLP